MPRVLLVVLALIGLVVPMQAMAECEGRNLFDPLLETDPQAHQAILDRARAVPNGAGKFWKIEKPGIRASYLFGTFHDTETHQFVPSDAWDLLASSDAALFELSLAEQARMEADIVARPLELIYNMEAPPLSSRLPADAIDAVETALEKRGVPLQAVEQMRGWMLIGLLGYPPCQITALQRGEDTLDARMAKFAKERGVPDFGLETYEQSLEAIAAMPSDSFDEWLGGMALTSSIEEDLHRTRLDFYAAGEIMALAEYEIWEGERQGLLRAREIAELFFDAALTVRNKAWMENLVPALEDGNAFVAVGALHVPGETGLVELLRAEGWTVTRLDG